MGVSIYDERAPFLRSVVVDDAASPGIETAVSSFSTPVRVDALLVSSTDSVAHTLVFGMEVGGARGILGAVEVPAGAGVDPAVPIVDVVALLAPIALAGFVLAADVGIQYDLDAAPSSGTVLTLLTLGGML